MPHLAVRVSRRALLLLVALASVASAQSVELAGGASVFVLDSAEIAASNARSLTELLAARIPGLSVMRSGGSAEDGASLRMRGAHSIYLPDAPLLVVDGVRVSARQAMSPIGSAVQPSELDELLPEDLARVEVLLGPAAAARYGPGAADGVIVVSTKGGAPGPISARARTDAGVGFARDDWPANNHRSGISTSTGAPVIDCSIVLQTRGICTPTALSRFDPLVQASPFRIERTAAAHLSASGGFAGAGGYVGTTAERTDGVLAGDERSRLGARAHLSRAFPWHFSLDASGGAIRDDALAPHLDGILGAGLFGRAQDDSLHGYDFGTHRPAPPQSLRADRAMGSVILGWRPDRWFDARLVAGHDRVSVQESTVDDPVSLDTAIHVIRGLHAGWRHDDVQSLGGSAAASWHAPWRFAGRTSLAWDQHAYTATSFDTLEYPNVYSPGFRRARTITRGVSVDQQLVWHDRLTIEAGAWRGGPLTYAAQPHSETFPWANAAWSAGGIGPASEVRLRAAYGEAATFDPDDLLGHFGPDTLPHPTTGAQRTREVEGGVDLSFGTRVSASLTAFGANSTHLVDISGSQVLGTGVFEVHKDDAMRNSGVELLVNARLLDRAGIHWTLAATFATLRNRVTATSAGKFPVMLDSGTVIQRGLPVGGWWVTPYTWADSNHDGMISVDEVKFGRSATVGSSLPAVESSLRSGLELPRGISAALALDYRGGYRLRDEEAVSRCNYRVANCRGAQDPSTPLAEQAAATAVEEDPWAAAFIEDASFLRLRELSFRWTIPRRWSRVVGDASAISLVGLDLLTFTRYGGADPEVTDGAPDHLARYDELKVPVVPRVLLRIDLGTRAGG